MQDTAFDTANSLYLTHAMADTGDTMNGEYMNFDYRFTDGWAAFKIIWNYGEPVMDLFSNNLGVPVSFQNKVLEFDYKGALPSHTISVLFAASAGCGDVPSFYPIGKIPSSAVWTKAVLPLPDGVDTIQGIRELRFVINNKDTVSGPRTSGPGNLKIDNILVRTPSAGVVRRHKQFSSNQHGYFTPRADGMAGLSFYNAKGALLFNNTISVFAGKRYSLYDFATRNSGFARSQIYLIKIQGPGIDITGKIR
jgi:hypothetical protein